MARHLLRSPEALKECLGDTRAIPRRPGKKASYWWVTKVRPPGFMCIGFNVVDLATLHSQAVFLPRVANHENQPFEVFPLYTRFLLRWKQAPGSFWDG